MTLKVILISSGSSWTVPSDYGTPSTVDCFGCGAQGSPGIVFGSGAPGFGGGGGAFARKSNLALSPGANIPVQIGGVSSASRQTWFFSSTSVLADGGNGLLGGQSSNCVGDLVYSGGEGVSQGGGGGAAGPNGAGASGVSSTGGQGDAGFGGTGGAEGVNGNPGTEYTLTAGGTAGSGGGGGVGNPVGLNVGQGGAFGAGGGGAATGTMSPTGFPGVGCIIVTYTATSGPPPSGSHRRLGVSVA